MDNLDFISHGSTVYLIYIILSTSCCVSFCQISLPKTMEFFLHSFECTGQDCSIQSGLFSLKPLKVRDQNHCMT